MKHSFYIFTNGRQSIRYCKMSLDEQSCKIDPILVENKKLDEGYNDILDNGKAKFFVKIDDDFLFHSRAMEYIVNSINKNPNYVLYSYLLWDIRKLKILQSVKAYNRKLLNKYKIRFRADPVGKVDQTFLKDIAKLPNCRYADSSVVAVHAQCCKDDISLHNEVWNKKILKYRHIKDPRFPIEQQYRDREQLVNKCNARGNTRFNKYLKGKGIR